MLGPAWASNSGKRLEKFFLEVKLTQTSFFLKMHLSWKKKKNVQPIRQVHLQIPPNRFVSLQTASKLTTALVSRWGAKAAKLCCSEATDLGR